MNACSQLPAGAAALKAERLLTSPPRHADRFDARQASIMVHVEHGTREQLEPLLLTAGCQVRATAPGVDIVRAVLDDEPTVLVLEMLPARYADLQVVRDVRWRWSNLGVLLISVLGSPEDIARGLDAGADDYIAIPFDQTAFRARLAALVRRVSHNVLVVELRELTIDPIRRTVARADRSIWLSPKEFDVLYYLARHSDQVVSQDCLARHVWGHRDCRSSDTYRQTIRTLRRKLDRPGEAPFLHTIWGEGYSLSANR